MSFSTERLWARCWRKEDLRFARSLWGDAEVMAFLDSRGGLDETEVARRLQREIDLQEKYGVQYWALFDIATSEFVGCSGLHPWPYTEERNFELGFHIAKRFWRRGFAREAGRGAIAYGFEHLGLSRIHAGHHPKNDGSRSILETLGFRYVEDVLYPPTGLMHPSYVLRREWVPAAGSTPKEERY